MLRRTYLREHKDDKYFKENLWAASDFGEADEFTVHLTNGNTIEHLRFISMFEGGNGAVTMRCTWRNGDKETFPLNQIKMLKWRPQLVPF